MVYQGLGKFDIYKKKNSSPSQKLSFDVVIMGAGSAGMGAAYSFLNSGKKVCIIDKLSGLGGNATQAGIHTWIESCNPSFLKPIFDFLVSSGKASGNWEGSILPSVFRVGGVGGGGLVLDKDALADKYYSDLSSDNNITIKLNTDFISINQTKNGRLNGIYVFDKNINEIIEISAKYFIDCSGDGILCRSACSIPDVDFFYGRDLQSKYNESIAPTSNNFKLKLNEPSQYFLISNSAPDDTELLNTITTVYRDDSITSGIPIIKPSYIQSDGYRGSGGWVNCMNGMTWTEGGVIVIQSGSENTEKIMKTQRALEYWKYIKLLAKWKQEQGETSFSAWNVSEVLSSNWASTFANYIGIRESFRINCENMLTQNDLGVTLLSNNMQDFIAEGSHTIDFHVGAGLNTSQLSLWNGGSGSDTLIRPYGVRYGSLIPKRLKNVLVAGRCAGMSQIALASCRVNKSMSQMGWAAGNAVKIIFDDNLNDVREVNVSKLQGSSYTNFLKSVQDMNDVLDSKWK